MAAHAESIIDQTRNWIEEIVIGLNFCPFAGLPWRAGRVQITVSEASRPEVLAEELADALIQLQRCDPAVYETTLLIHPNVLVDFLDYNDFLAIADQMLIEMGLDGELQIASFHPDYQFADTAPDDRSNATNRSPYPMLHLLRENSIEAATERLDHPEAIYERNIKTLESLDDRQWQDLFSRLENR